MNGKGIAVLAAALALALPFCAPSAQFTVDGGVLTRVESGGGEATQNTTGFDGYGTGEWCAPPDGSVAAGSGASDIFIYPPYRFRVCDAMLTNFHLPQSTLLMMASALAGRARIMCAYAMAVRFNYRFFSYCDCMLIV